MKEEVEESMLTIRQHIDRLERENAELRRSNTYLGRSVDELCDEVYELKKQQRKAS